MQLWRDMDADADVPPGKHWAEARFLAVWRKGLQPHFQAVDGNEGVFMQCLLAWQSVDEAANALAAGCRPG